MSTVQPILVENLSLFIPRVFTNITKSRIRNIFQNFNIGEVDHIDLVNRMDKNGTVYNNAYIHFKYWVQDPQTMTLQQKILNPNEEARIVYDDPYYWVLLNNTGTYHAPGAPKKRVNIESTTDNLSELTCHDNNISHVNCDLVSVDYVVALEKANNDLTEKCQLYESSVNYWMNLCNELRNQNDARLEQDNEPTNFTPLTIEDLTGEAHVIEKPELVRT